MRIGILDLQGAVVPHRTKLESLGIEPVSVKRSEHLENLAGIILPGGESSAMIHLAKLNSIWEPLKTFVQNKPAWGICAGSILLARNVSHPAQESLEAMDISIERNGYGRQNESFIRELTPTAHWELGPVEGVFIRAPIIRETDAKVKTLLTHNREGTSEPVLVREGNLLASTFHPELTSSNKLHQYFINLCRE